MIQVPCPTAELNRALSPLELGLPESCFADTLENKNNHHLYWEYKKYGRLFMTALFRDLEHNQFMMQMDQHTRLHQQFSEPKNKPTLEVMRDEIYMAAELDERLKFRKDRKGPYLFKPITASVLADMEAEYQTLK